VRGDRIALRPSVAKIYEAVDELQREYPDRRFTPDGHLVGSIGEVIASKALNLRLCPMSHEGHDALDAQDRPVQIKMTAGSKISMYGCCDQLIVLKIIPEASQAEVVYCGPMQPVWDEAGKQQKNGQRSIRDSRSPRSWRHWRRKP
jgi:hypothetical protein